MDDRTDKIKELVTQISPLLAGSGHEIQGAVLADLTAIWVSGHSLEGESTSSEDTQDMRKALMDMHYQLVAELVPINDRLLEEYRAEVQ